MVGRALVARLRDEGVRVLATARTYDAERELTAGAEPLHTDAAGLPAWRAEAEDAEALFHLGLPRLDPPLRARAARRRAAPAAAAAAGVAELAARRPVVMLSTGLVFGHRTTPAVDDEPVIAPAAVAAAALAAERALAPADARIVRVPWVHGPGGLAGDMVPALRTGRWRIVGPGDNRWAMLSADDAAGALLAALSAPVGVYTAAEPEAPTQLEVLDLVCRTARARRPDRLPPRFAALSMGGAMSEALSSSLWIATGRLADHGWAPRDDWREGWLSPAG
jgi:nucleoside-diphosphate-sugar epimerase